MRPELGLIDALFLAVALLGAACLLMAGIGTSAGILEKLLVRGRRPSTFDRGPRPKAQKVRR